jgi:hypothetical protein
MPKIKNINANIIKKFQKIKDKKDAIKIKIKRGKNIEPGLKTGIK